MADDRKVGGFEVVSALAAVLFLALFVNLLFFPGALCDGFGLTRSEAAFQSAWEEGSQWSLEEAVELALERPDAFRAVIGLESGLSRARMAPTLDFHDHPRISNEFRMQSMYGKTAPGNPEKNRREIAWTYGQSAPPVSKGDLYYNFIDHNLTGGEARRIDTSQVAVYLMTGQYDWGNSPAETKVLADQIKGARFVELYHVRARHNRLNTAAAKSIRMLTDLDPTAAPVSGDPARIQQIVWNLLTNAIKFTPEGGRIGVGIGESSVTPASFSLLSDHFPPERLGRPSVPI